MAKTARGVNIKERRAPAMPNFDFLTFKLFP